MLNDVFSDPKLRRAYLLTKLVLFVLAALATIPLAKHVGPKAWWGLGVFGLILLLLSLPVLISRPSVEQEPEEESPAIPELVELPIEDSLDLHPFAPSEIVSVVEDYLAEAQEAGFEEVRLIHGRGIGVQRERVRSLLDRHPGVLSYADAPPEGGGWGATIARLRPHKAPIKD